MIWGDLMAKQPGMGERACPKCKETIKVNASLCKHCRTEFSNEDIAAAKKEQRKSAKLTGIGCLSLVLLLGFCGYVAGSGDSTAPIPDKPGKTAKADVTAFYRKVMTAIEPCDNSGQRVATASKAGDLVALYQAASSMEAACLPTSTDISDVEVPASVGKEAYKKLTETRKICENTYSHRWSSAGKIKEMLDEGGSVGRLAGLKETTDLVQAGALVCVAGLVGQAMALGATEADLK